MVLSLAAAPALAQAGFDGSGRVIALDAIKGSVTLDHGPIPGLMAAGRGEFPVQRPDLLRDVRIGDLVRFSLATDERSHGVLALSRVEPRPGPDQGSAAGLGLAAPSPWLALASAAGALALAGAAASIFWWRLREVQRGLVATAEIQDELRRGVRLIADALEEIAAMLRGRGLVEVRWRTAAIQALRGKSTGEATPARTVPESLLVIRQGEAELFRNWQEQPVTPGVQVIWDRRGGERRRQQEPVLVERRRGERRQPAPSTWTELGFVLAADRAAESST